MPMARTEYYDASINPNDAVNSGRIKSITDAKGRTTTFNYPVSGFEDSRAKARIEITDADGNLSVTESDQFGNVILSKNPLGFKTSRYFESSVDPTLPA